MSSHSEHPRHERERAPPYLEHPHAHENERAPLLAVNDDGRQHVVGLRISQFQTVLILV